MQPLEAQTAVKEPFHVAYWLARTYARGERPAADLAFDPGKLPRTPPLPKPTLERLQRLDAELREKDEKLAAVLAGKAALDEELQRLRAEIAKARQASAAQPDTHDYSEKETRDFFIDLLLKEAGWPLDQPRDRVGLDREAAKRAFASFLKSRTLGANQIEFVNLIVDHLTQHGVMTADLLYESPFTDLAPTGPGGLFDAAQVGELLSVLDAVRATAA